MTISARVLGGAALWSLLAVAAGTLVAEVLTYGFAVQPIGEARVADALEYVLVGGAVLTIGLSRLVEDRRWSWFEVPAGFVIVSLSLQLGPALQRAIRALLRPLSPELWQVVFQNVAAFVPAFAAATFFVVVVYLWLGLPILGRMTRGARGWAAVRFDWELHRLAKELRQVGRQRSTTDESRIQGAGRGVGGVPERRWWRVG